METDDTIDARSESSADDGIPSGDQPPIARVIIDTDDTHPRSIGDKLRDLGNFGGFGGRSGGTTDDSGGTDSGSARRTRKPRATKAEAFTLGQDSGEETVNIAADVRRNVRQIFKGISKKWGPHWQLEKDEIELICIPLTKLLKTTVASNVSSSPKVMVGLVLGSVALVSFPKFVVTMQHNKQMAAVDDAIAHGQVVNFQGNLNGFGPPPSPQTGQPIEHEDMDGIDPNPVMTPKDEMRSLIAQLG